MMSLPQYIQTETRSSSLKKNFSTYFSTTKQGSIKIHEIKRSVVHNEHHIISKTDKLVNSETCFSVFGDVKP